MNISFAPVTTADLPLYYEWAKIPHVRDSWFLPGYEPPEAIEAKVASDGPTYPYLICLDEQPIGYIQTTDLDAFYAANPDVDEPLRAEPPGSFSIDLFIADPALLGRGIGTETLRLFAFMLFDWPRVQQLVIDPAADNKRAIRCYQRVGFQPTRTATDAVTVIQVLTLPRQVILTPYNPSWPAQYAQMEAHLHTLLRNADLAHMGSTAVPGLAAKPIIDILIGVDDVTATPLPYPATHFDERILYTVSDPAGRRTHHLHVVPRNGTDWRRQIAFRDLLRTHPDKALAYQTFKLDLAKTMPTTLAYADAKTSFVQSLESSFPAP